MTENLLPFKAIFFQFLFLLAAIAVESAVLRQFLDLDYKTSAQYATTVNLLSTVLGWIIFFVAEPQLPRDLQSQLIGFILLSQAFTSTLQQGVPIAYILLGIAIFLGTFWVKLQGLKRLEQWLDKVEKQPTEPTKRSFVSDRKNRDRRNRLIRFQYSSRAYAVFVANACSFSAILFLLLVRLFGQNRYS